MPTIINLTPKQKEILRKYPELKKHFKNHLIQDIDYYFSEYLRKDLLDSERQDLGLPHDRKQI